jgi:hypothetical protein
MDIRPVINIIGLWLVTCIEASWTIAVIYGEYYRELK